MSTELHRFGIDVSDHHVGPHWKHGVEKLLTAIVTNPSLNIGDRNSEIIFPETPPARGKGGTVTASTGGAFWTRYTDADGHTWLQGGQVKSGSGNFTIADKKVIDASTGPTEPAGDILVLEVTVTGYVVDGVLLAGLRATAADYVAPSVSTVDNDTLPTASDYTGKKVFIEIGRWTDTDFLPVAPGNIRIAFCPGSYQIHRY